MIPSTPAFDAARNIAYQEPVWVFALPTLGLTYTMRKGQAGLSSAATWMQVPTGVTQSIDNLNGKTTIGSLSVTMVDVGRTLLPLFASTNWYGAAAQILLGFAGLTYPTDYITMFAGIVESVVPTDDHTGWVFTVVDKNRILKDQIYTVGDVGANPVSSTNPRTLDGNPLALALALLETELAIPAGDIDTAAIAALQTGRFSTTRMLFSLTKAQDAATFLEQELLRPHGLYHFVRYDGRISIGDMLAPPIPVPIAFAFGDSNTLGTPAFDQKTIYNWVEFQLDYDGSNYLDIEEFTDAASITKYGLQQQLSITSQGMRTNLQGASRAGITARRIFQRYANGPTTMVKLTAPSLQACIVEVGDYVTVTNRLLENMAAGTLGWTNRVCQVMNVQPAWSSGKITFSLLDVTPMLRPAFQYAPDTVPSWPTATTPQRQEYMFMANSSSEQSDGTAAAGVF